jgi:UDP-glucose 4-epimerase
MNILITGCKGFIGREMSDYFSDKAVNLMLTDRATLNPLQYDSVRKFFDSNKVDVVIHTAVKGGKRNQVDNIQTFHDNIMMFNNLASFSDRFSFMFNFGSGAEFDRANNIALRRESEIEFESPTDYYGLSKNLISRKIVTLDSNIFNLRLFGCFGKHEEPQRLFRNTLNLISSGKDPTICQDKYMDYFYAQDVGRVINYIIHNKEQRLPKDINLCYGKKYLLSEQVDFITDSLTESDIHVKINKTGLANSYTGNAEALSNLEIQLEGLQIGIQKCLKSWKKY